MHRVAHFRCFPPFLDMWHYCPYGVYRLFVYAGGAVAGHCLVARILLPLWDALQNVARWNIFPAWNFSQPQLESWATFITYRASARKLMMPKWPIYADLSHRVELWKAENEHAMRNNSILALPPALHCGALFRYPILALVIDAVRASFETPNNLICKFFQLNPAIFGRLKKHSTVRRCVCGRICIKWKRNQYISVLHHS